MKNDYLIIEDEVLAADELQRMMKKLRPDYHLIGVTGTIKETCEMLRNSSPDLLLSDIRLSDGLSFDIFFQMSTDTPIIFTTAFDEYAIQAFKNNSVDYLLKPIDEEFLERALAKFEKHQQILISSEQIKHVATEYQSHIIKTRFLVQIGDEFRHVETKDIAYFYSEEKYTYLYTTQNKKYIIPYTLDSLQNMIDNKQFFRISRNCICAIQGIARCSRYFSGRLCVQLKPESPANIIVSRSRAADVLNWMDDKI